MKPTTLFKTTSSIIITLLFLSGCNNEIDNGFLTSVYLRDKFDQTVDSFSHSDDEITMSLSIKNDSTKEKTLNFTSNQKYDFVIKDSSDTTIWTWSTDSDFKLEEKPSAFTMNPTDIITVSYIWTQAIDPSATGSYTLEAYFIGYGPIATTTFTIN